MANNSVLLVICLTFLFVQGQDNSGNAPPNGNSTLPKEPKSIASRSVTAGCGCNRVLTFDDISAATNIRFNPITNGYGGLTWTNAYYMNTTWEAATYGWNGYATGRTSGIFVGFNANGLQMSMSVPFGQYFQLNSMILAAAWNNNLVLTIKGYRAGNVIYQTVGNLQVTSKTTMYALKWSGIDKITFDSAGGTPYPGLSGVGTQFVVEDMDISI